MHSTVFCIDLSTFVFIRMCLQAESALVIMVHFTVSKLTSVPRLFVLELTHRSCGNRNSFRLCTTYGRMAPLMAKPPTACAALTAIDWIKSASLNYGLAEGVDEHSQGFSRDSASRFKLADPTPASYHIPAEWNALLLNNKPILNDTCKEHR